MSRKIRKLSAVVVIALVLGMIGNVHVSAMNISGEVHEEISVASAYNITMPYTATKYLAPGAWDTYTFTASFTGKFTACTTGSMDTVITVYQGTSATGKPLDSDDDSGLSYNASVACDVVRTQSYTVVVQSYDEELDGNYTIHMYRGLPTSGSERIADLDQYNSSAYNDYTNCYTYALHELYDYRTGAAFRYNGMNPGEFAGQTFSEDILASATVAKQAIVTRVQADCISWGGSASDFYEVEHNTVLPEGYYKVALLLYPGEDYHWVRQLSDQVCK